MATNNPRSNSSRIDEELVCVDALAHVLTARGGCSAIEIHREEQDPPDFTLTIDGAAFPAEVTSIVSEQQYHAHCDALAKAIQRQATELGVLSGSYAFTVLGKPSIPKPSSREGRSLLDHALGYIRATQQQAESCEFDLQGSGRDRITLHKLSPAGVVVGLLRVGCFRWEGETQDELVQLVQDAVDQKLRKLAKAQLTPQGTLLLLYDAFGYAGPEGAIAALERVRDYESFHSVFWAASFTDRANARYPAEPGREGLFLFSHRREWNRIGTVPLSPST